MKRLASLKSGVVVKLFNWVEKNPHKFTKKKTKQCYVEFCGYWESFKSGNLSKRRAQRLSKKILVLGMILVAALLGGSGSPKWVISGATFVEAGFVKFGEGLVEKLAGLLVEAFQYGPRIIKTIKKISYSVVTVVTSFFQRVFDRIWSFSL